MNLGLSIALFLVAAVGVVRAGTGLAAGGDQIAERTGLGRLFVGTILLAFATSLPELVTDITAAATGVSDLAVIDLSGSSIAKMAILAIIDLDYRGRVWPAVELGHARVAAVANVLTALAALGLHTPPGAAIGWVVISTIMILCVYLAAIAGFAACDDRRGRGRGPWLIPPGADRVIRAAGRPLGQADRHPVRCGHAGDTRRCSSDDDRSRADSRVEWDITDLDRGAPAGRDHVPS